MILKDKVVIVSGIGPGLGQELAINAGREGAKVVLAARTQAFLDEVNAEDDKGNTVLHLAAAREIQQALDLPSWGDSDSGVSADESF